MDANETRSKSRLKKSKSGSPEESGSHVTCSRSYIVPGNPLAPIYEGSHTRVTPYDKPLNPIARQENVLHPDNGVATPMYRPYSSRMGTPAPSGSGTAMPSQWRDRKTKNDFVLPEIGLNVWPDRCNGSTEEILHEWGKDGLLPEPQFIRHTRSGIAYNFLYGPPTRKPRHLPRIVSEGALQKRETRHQREEKLLVDAIMNQERSPSRRQPKQTINRSGGVFNDCIRSATEKKRQQRERKNLEKTRSKLLLQEERASRLGNLTDNTAARVQQVLAKQGEIREHERMRIMENFIKKKKKKN